MSIVTVETILSAAVASPAGTFAVSYPTGYVQGDFTGVNASATAYMVVNGNDRWTEADDKFDISYGASTVTVTNKTGATLPAGTEVLLGLARIGLVDEVVALTHTVGTAGNTIVDVTATPTQTTVNNNFASVSAKLNQILAILKTKGLM